MVLGAFDASVGAAWTIASPSDATGPDVRRNAHRVQRNRRGIPRNVRSAFGMDAQSLGISPASVAMVTASPVMSTASAAMSRRFLVTPGPTATMDVAFRAPSTPAAELSLAFPGY